MPSVRPSLEVVLGQRHQKEPDPLSLGGRHALVAVAALLLVLLIRGQDVAHHHQPDDGQRHVLDLLHDDGEVTHPRHLTPHLAYFPINTTIVIMRRWWWKAGEQHPKWPP